MHYSKAMVDLIQEARRRAPSDVKPSIKLANPEILDELTHLYHSSKDHVFKAIVKEVFNLAGDPWPEKLLDQSELPKDSAQESSGFITKIYRGQTILQPKMAVNESPVTSGKAHSNRPKRIYRGRVIE